MKLTKELYTKTQTNCINSLAEYIAFRANLARNYGPDWNKPGVILKKEDKHLQKLARIVDKANTHMYKLLDSTGHDWRNGIPVVHVTTALTFEEVVSGDKSNCPKAWGY